jgi:hypothetical protein
MPRSRKSIDLELAFNIIVVICSSIYKISRQVRACLEHNATQCGFTEALVSVQDANDNAPKFSQAQYRIRIPSAEKLSPGTELFRANATDSDSGLAGHVRYSLRTSAIFQELFSIDPDTGVITLASPLTPENAGGPSTYRIEVDAKDEGKPPLGSSASIHFVLDERVNPHSPQFDKVPHFFWFY